MEYVREILKSLGISPERIQMFYCTAAEGQRFQNEVTRISEIIKKLGSNPIKKFLSSEKEAEDSIKKKKK